MSDPSTTAPLPYEEVTDHSFAKQAAKEFTLDRPTYGMLVLHGPCPRCRGAMEVPLFDLVVRTTDVTSLPPRPQPPVDASDSSHVEPIICLCEDEHPGRPAGRKGCGAYWTLAVTTGR
nr:hypothetical protein [Micromonospora purpureochromogenes]